jgi:hypothetical protein
MQTPDTEPGNYYVTVVDGGRTGIVAGPFRNDHRAALAMVNPARDLANRLDPRTHFYGFGTTRFPETFEAPGVLNEKLGISFTATTEAT